jgi:hypothetical protein
MLHRPEGFLLVRRWSILRPAAMFCFDVESARCLLRVLRSHFSWLPSAMISPLARAVLR